jgi:hypothetical protein
METEEGMGWGTVTAEWAEPGTGVWWGGVGQRARSLPLDGVQRLAHLQLSIPDRSAMP